MRKNVPAIVRRFFNVLHEKETLAGYLLIAPPLFLISLIIFYPAVGSIIHTLTIDLDGNTGFTLSQYQYFFEDPLSTRNLIYSLEVSVIVVLLLFVVSLPIALYLRFSKGWIAGAIQVLSLFPLFVPGIILSFALLRFFISHGPLDAILSFLGVTDYSTPYLKPGGAIIGLIWDGVPLASLLLTAGLQQVDDELIDCARDIGANNWQIFRRIILPLIKSPVLIVLALAFLGVFGAYTVPYLLGPASPEMMSVYMARTFQQLHEPVRAQTQAVITFLISSAVGYLYVRTIARRQLDQE